MAHRLLCTLPLALALLASPAAAQLGPDPVVDPGTTPDPTVPVEVDASDLETARLLLSAHHGIPDADAFTGALDAPVPALRVLATDEDVFPLYRQRALSALGYWPDAWLGDELARLATDPASGDLLQHHAVLLLARLYPEQSTPVVRAWLDDDDVQRRLTAIEAVDAFGSDTLRTALEDRMTIEPSPVVVERIEEALELR